MLPSSPGYLDLTHLITVAPTSATLAAGSTGEGAAFLAALATTRRGARAGVTRVADRAWTWTGARS